MNSSDTTFDPKSAALESLKLFRIIFKSATQHFHEIEKVAGIGGASLWALSEIVKSALAKAMSIHQSTASNLLEKLETNGYILRIRSTDDRRVVNLSLTDKGREILAKSPQPYRGVLPDALMRLDPETLELLNQNLIKLVAGLERKQFEDGFEPLGKS
jgi:DNA-binding MarR family transcriptional regulator